MGGPPNHKTTNECTKFMCFQTFEFAVQYLIGRLTKDQEVTDIWPVSELLNAYINIFFVKFETGDEAYANIPYITEI